MSVFLCVCLPLSLFVSLSVYCLYFTLVTIICFMAHKCTYFSDDAVICSAMWHLSTIHLHSIDCTDGDCTEQCSLPQQRTTTCIVIPAPRESGQMTHLSTCIVIPAPRESGQITHLITCIVIPAPRESGQMTHLTTCIVIPAPRESGQMTHLTTCHAACVGGVAQKIGSFLEVYNVCI